MVISFTDFHGDLKASGPNFGSDKRKRKRRKKRIGWRRKRILFFT